MDNILLINNGMKFQGYLFAKALEKYFKVSIVGNPSPTHYNYPMDEDWYSAHFYSPDKFFKQDMTDYDVVLGLDQGCVSTVSMIKRNHPEILCGLHILDFPMHVFQSTKDFNPTALWRWENIYAPEMPLMDFTIHNQKNSLSHLRELLKTGGNHKFVLYPVNPIKYKNEKENLITYSGRMHPDKGLHYIISALGIIKKEIRPKLLAIGDGFKFNDFASHLGVDYEQIICSEEKKWEYYSKSKAIVCGADNPYIPPLCIMEGISVGIPGICFNYTENKIHYGDYAYYANFLDINELANLIKFVCTKEKDYDSEKAIKWYKENASYEVWANKVKEVIDECKR